MLTQKRRLRNSVKLASNILILGLAMACSTETIDERSGPASEVRIGVDNIWADESFGLQSTVYAFEILVQCDGGYSQTVTTPEFSLPIRNTNCVAKLQSFMRNDNQLYRPKTGQNFVTWQPSDRAVFACSEGTGCLNQPDLSVYVVKQLPAPQLTVFAEIRYKFTENNLGQDVVIQQSDLNFTRVVVGDEPPPFTLRTAYEGAIADQLELLVECDSFQIGSTLADSICETTRLGAVRVALAPYPETEITDQVLADLMASSQLIANASGALHIDQGQFGMGRGGFSVPLSLPTADQYIFVMSTADSDSYTYHRLVREEAQSYAVGGSISGLDAGETITLSLNSEEHTISANGDFAFPTLVSDLDAFYVSIALAPTGKSCAVANGEGNIESAAITNVMVTCSP